MQWKRTPHRHEAYLSLSLLHVRCWPVFSSISLRVVRHVLAVTVVHRSSTHPAPWGLFNLITSYKRIGCCQGKWQSALSFQYITFQLLLRGGACFKIHTGVCFVCMQNNWRKKNRNVCSYVLLHVTVHNVNSSSSSNINTIMVLKERLLNVLQMVKYYFLDTIRTSISEILDESQNSLTSTLYHFEWTPKNVHIINVQKFYYVM